MKQDSENVLYIKNMVCPRCITAVENFFRAKNLRPVTVELGKVTLQEPVSNDELSIIADGLNELGFELLNDKKDRTVNAVKNAVIDFVHYSDGMTKSNLSDFIVAKLHQDYSTLSKLFSEREHTTIEKYFIAQKIEKVKELLSYGELNLNEIAFKLNYSSSAYLSAQFKQITGMTPSQFKNTELKNRRTLDSI